MAGLIDFAVLEKAECVFDPYPHLVAPRVICAADARRVRADYPDIDIAGFIPLERLAPGGAFSDLVADLTSERMAAVLGAKLGCDLSDKPSMVTVRRLSKPSDGSIHNDSERKVVTMLIYLNEHWGGSAGSLRVLNSNSGFDDYTMEVPPVEGTIFAFRRTEKSWHGHLPYKGERYVIQTTYLRSEQDRRKKQDRGTSWFARLFRRTG